MVNDSSEITIATTDAEESLIGAILIESTTGTREAINKVALQLHGEDFRDYFNKKIFDAMTKCPLPPHQINVARQLHADKTLENGMVAHLCHCVSICPCSLDYMDYAQAIKRYSDIRTGKKHTYIRGAI
jgi:replicative DNA helicase